MAPAAAALRERLARRQVRARHRPRLPHRHPGARPPADPAAAARRARRPQHRAASSPAIAARRSARSTRRCGRRRSSSTARTSRSSPGSTRTSRRRRSGARSRSTCTRARRYDGVFAMWYGKGPGVDRCGDVFKHANHAGTSKHGGVLVLAGDDHGAKSSTLPHQSDHMFSAAMMPVLYPSSVQEILDLGLHGWAMSRYSGCWVGFKCVADTVESSASVVDRPGARRDHRSRRLPAAARRRVDPLARPRSSQPKRGCRTTRSTRRCTTAAPTSSTASSSTRPQPRLGIVTSGKSYLDVRQALDDLGITEADAAEIGLRLYKVAMPWPLEPEGVRQFAEGLEEILVVEEKRQVVEYQLKEQLYNWRDDVRPRVVGKFDEKGEWVRPHGDWLLPATSRAHAGDDRAGDRAAHPPPRPAPARGREAQRARRLDQRQGSGARQAQDRAASASRTSARAARTTRRPRCPRAAAPRPASAAT